MHRFIQFCINTNIIVAIAALALYKITEILFGFTDSQMSFFIFFSTLFAYNYMRINLIIDSKKTNCQSNLFNKYRKEVFFILVTSAFFTCWCAYLLGFYFIKLIIVPAVICLLYPWQFNIGKHVFGIRKIPLIKIFLISFTWSYITFAVPLIHQNIEIDYIKIDFFFQRILFVIAISIPFDIRDINHDKIKTIPNTIGIYHSKLFAWFCLLLIDCLLIIDLINNTITLPYFIAFFLSIELCSVVIYFTAKNHSNMFYGVIVESLSIIMCLFVLIASFI